MCVLIFNVLAIPATTNMRGNDDDDYHPTTNTIIIIITN